MHSWRFFNGITYFAQWPVVAFEEDSLKDVVVISICTSKYIEPKLIGRFWWQDVRPFQMKNHPALHLCNESIRGAYVRELTYHLEVRFLYSLFEAIMRRLHFNNKRAFKALPVNFVMKKGNNHTEAPSLIQSSSHAIFNAFRIHIT